LYLATIKLQHHAKQSINPHHGATRARQSLDLGFPVEYTLTEVATKFGDDDLTLADLIGTQAH